VSVGDVNGDGFADVVVGVGGADEVLVFQSSGSAGILSAQCSATACPEATTALIGSAGTTSFGQEQGVGDVNGDGFDDLAIGNTSYSGAYVFLSTGTGGLPATSDLGASAFVTTNGAGADGFGRKVVLHDLNGDGYADLIVGESLVNANQGQTWQFLSQGTSGIAGANLSTDPSAGTVLQGIAATAFGGTISP
jgi:FG-GAP-like repeat/FG-GAP repeat